MIEVRVHGRGGQGAVLASLLLAHAAHRRGYHVQAFPEFGVERRGVPVTAFARLSTEPILRRYRITRPHHLLVLDAALGRHLSLSDGVVDGGAVVVNAADPQALEAYRGCRGLAWVDGSAIAAKHGIGTPSAPIANTTMVGAFARVTGIVGKDDLASAIAEMFGAKGDRNVAAAFEAFEAVRVEGASVVEAQAPRGGPA